MHNPGWLAWTLFSAFSWACVLVLEKTCIHCIDPKSIAMMRCLIIFLFLFSSSFFSSKSLTFGAIDTKTWLIISLAGLCGALSWSSYFIALQAAPVSKVSVLDSLSIVFVILFATLIGEPLTLTTVFGMVLFTLGSVLIAL